MNFTRQCALKHIQTRLCIRSLLSLCFEQELFIAELSPYQFIATKMKTLGPGLDQDSLTFYNFGYERPLPFPSISLSPDTTMRFNLQTSGMQTQSRASTVVIGEKYVDRFGEIMTVVDRIHEETQALPLSIYVETEHDIKTTNISSRVTPTLVRILYRAVLLTTMLLSTELYFRFPKLNISYISLFWTDHVNHLCKY